MHCKHSVNLNTTQKAKIMLNKLRSKKLAAAKHAVMLIKLRKAMQQQQRYAAYFTAYFAQKLQVRNAKHIALAYIANNM